VDTLLPASGRGWKKYGMPQTRKITNNRKTIAPATIKWTGIFFMPLLFRRLYYRYFTKEYPIFVID
jgi:hypothetical protein